MSAYLTEIMESTRELIAATWPDTVAGGIWEAEDQELIPWSEMQPPCAGIMFGEIEDTDDYAADSDTYVIPMAIFYVGEVDGSSETLREKMEDLRDALIGTGIDGAQVIAVKMLTNNNDLEANQLFTEKQFNHRVCRVTAEVICGLVIAT